MLLSKAIHLDENLIISFIFTVKQNTIVFGYMFKTGTVRSYQKKKAVFLNIWKSSTNMFHNGWTSLVQPGVNKSSSLLHSSKYL